MEIKLPVRVAAKGVRELGIMDADGRWLTQMEIAHALNAPLDCDFTQYVEQKRAAQLRAMRVLLKTICHPHLYSDEQLSALLEKAEG